MFGPVEVKLRLNCQPPEGRSLELHNLGRIELHCIRDRDIPAKLAYYGNKCLSGKYCLSIRQIMPILRRVLDC